MIKQIPVPTRSVFVAAAAAVSATKGSRVCLYCSGSCWPPANGLRRLVGMCVCSGTHSDSKLRASASRASSSMRIAYSVAKMQTPMCMRDPPGSAGRGGARRGWAGHEGKVRVRGEPAAAGARERTAVGEGAARVPGGGDPAAIARDRAARVVDVDREVADDRPHAVPLLLLDHVEALDEGHDGAEGDDVWRAQPASGCEIDGAHAGLPGAQPVAEGRQVVGHQDGKVASGMKAG